MISVFVNLMFYFTKDMVCKYKTLSERCNKNTKKKSFFFKKNGILACLSVKKGA